MGYSKRPQQLLGIPSVPAPQPPTAESQRRPSPAHTGRVSKQPLSVGPDAARRNSKLAMAAMPLPKERVAVPSQPAHTWCSSGPEDVMTTVIREGDFVRSIA